MSQTDRCGVWAVPHLPVVLCRPYRRATGLFAGLLLCLTSSVMAAPPDFSFPDLTGEPHPMSEYIGQGKWTVVNILGPGCSSCQKDLPQLVRFHEEHHRSDATVLGIALDYPSFGDADPTEVAALVDDYLVNFPVLLGKRWKIEQFGGGPLVGMPTTYVFQPEGDLVGVKVGAITTETIENFISNYSSGN